MKSEENSSPKKQPPWVLQPGHVPAKEFVMRKLQENSLGCSSGLDSWLSAPKAQSYVLLETALLSEAGEGSVCRKC